MERRLLPATPQQRSIQPARRRDQCRSATPPRRCRISRVVRRFAIIGAALLFASAAAAATKKAPPKPAPKGKTAAKAWAAHFLDEAKADGTVRRALDGNGFTSDKVAP